MNQPNPQFRVQGQLRSRINMLAHQSGQRYELRRRDELLREIEAQGRAGKASSELLEYLDSLED